MRVYLSKTTFLHTSALATILRAGIKFNKAVSWTEEGKKHEKN